jgi:hypothetical protein
VPCESKVESIIINSKGWLEANSPFIMAHKNHNHMVGTLTKMSLEEKPPHGGDGIIEQEEKPREQIINPWEVTAADEYGIDYDKLIVTFGTRRIDESTLERFERLTGRKPHRYLRRGHFFSQRYSFLR